MVNLDNVMEAVSSVTGVPSEKVFGRDRFREIAAARHLFCYTAKLHTDCTLATIGRFLGRDHTTAINSIKVCNDMIDVHDEVFVSMINEINSYIIKEFKKDHEIRVIMPYSVKLSDVREFFEGLGCVVR